MYVPPAFDASTDADHWLPTLLRRDPFVDLVSLLSGVPFISHLPVMARRARSGAWVLSGHWARANPQWQGLDGAPATVVVHGPHTYISPGAYPEPARAVPTWAYAVAHASGRIELVTDAEDLLALVDEMSDHFESSKSAPWSRAGAHPSLSQLVRSIIGFRLQVEHVRVALKLNQHHDADKRRRTISGLHASGRRDAAEIADWMQATLQPTTVESDQNRGTQPARP
jgi:transcriptional regulator